MRDCCHWKGAKKFSFLFVSSVEHLPRTYGRMTRALSMKSIRAKEASRATHSCRQGQHNALVAVQEQLGPDERLFAFLDDIYMTSGPNKVVPTFNILRRELWTHARIQIHLGRPKSGTKVEGNHQVAAH